MITIVTAVLTVVYIVLVADQIHWSAVSALSSGLGAGGHRRAGLRDDRLRARLGQRRRRLLALPAAPRPRAGGVVGWTTFGSSHRAGRAAGLRPAAGRLVARACAPRSPPTRSARWPTLLPDLVPGAVRPRRGARAWSAARCSTSTPPGWRCSPLGAAGAAVRRGADRRRRHDRSARSTSCSSRSNFLGQFEGFLITLGRADRRLVRHHAGRHRCCATATTPSADLYDPARPVRRRPVAPGRADRGRHRARLGPGHQLLAPAG